MFDTLIADFAVHILLQSLVLITIGLLAVRVCGRHKPAVQSTILRVTLIAVLFCPLASLTLSKVGITGYALLPAWESDQIVQSDSPTILQLTNSLPPVADENTVRRIKDPNGIADTNRLPGTDFDSTSLPHTGNPETGLTAQTVPKEESFSDPVTSNRSLPVVGWIVSLIWVTGAGFFLTKLLLACHQVSQLCRNSQPAEAAVQELCRKTSKTLSLNPPQVKIAASVHSPCLIGIWNPVILLPEQKTLTEPVLRDIFLHELAHLARRDCLFHLLARIATAILFFQPLVWRLSRRLELIADDLCDDYVIHFGSCRKSYANTLVDFAEQLTAPALATDPSLAMVSLRSSLSRRILRIMDSSRSPTLRLPARWVVLIAVMGITVTASAALIVNARTSASEEKITSRSQIDQDQPTAVTPKAAGLRLRGRVVNPDGQPVKATTIGLVSTGRDQRKQIKLASTNDQGKFDFSIPASSELYDSMNNGGMLIAQAEGYGPAVESVYQFETSGEMRKTLLDKLANSHTPPGFLNQARKRIHNATSTFQLVADDTPLTGRVVNIEGQPVAGASLRVTQLNSTETGSLDEWEKAAEKSGADFYEIRMLLTESLGNDVGGATLEYIPTVMTDRNGRFTLKGLGRERIVKLLISGPGIATSYVYTRTRKGKIIEVPMQASNPWREKMVYHPSEFTHVAGPSHPVSGVVRDTKTHQPVPGVTLQSYRLAGHRTSGWSEGLVQTVTDDQGRYRLEGLPIGKNEVICLNPKNQPYLLSKFVAETSAGIPVLKKDVDLTRGIWVEGRAYDKASGKPVRGGRVHYFAFNDNPFLQPVKKSLAHLTTHYKLQSDGTYRIPALPGPGIVAVMADDHEQYQRGKGAENIKGKKYQQMNAFYTVPYLLIVSNFHFMAEVNPAEDAKSVQLDFPFDSGRTLQIKVITQDGKAVQNGNYVGLMEEFPSWHGFSNGQLEIRGYRPEQPRRVQAIDPERKQVGYLLIDEKDPSDLKITLEPWAEITGRLVDEFGIPQANIMLSDSFSVLKNDPNVALLPPNPEQKSGGSTKYVTDKNGRFMIRGLIPGIKYSAYARELRKNGTSFSLGDLVNGDPLQPGEVRDLGDIQFNPAGAE
ncbi:M56 family metallopeptidase [Gimesia algae]|uniref:Regulatory protein BlaR1 n=1 Tax=Gimesia algae TaxID=2527971 RepID=A0A517VGS8_9PLAN|nr:M56 family metallopeptidase [Gimesia algae]QDT92221.1 Regulatory protein BlaR1 [Gimesia algae]